MTINCSEKIGEIGLDRLVDTYLCSKNGKDPTKCIDCLSLDGCPAGKRAVELLEEETASKPKRKYGTDEGRKKAGQIQADRARQRAEEASKASDAVEYLMNKYGISRVIANNRVTIYKKKYPDLTFGTTKHPKKLDPVEETDSDEVSLDEFLKTSVSSNEDLDGDEITEPKQPDISPEGDFFETLKKEYDRVRTEWNGIWFQICKLTERHEYLEKVMSSMETLMDTIEPRKNGNSYNEKDGV